MTNEELCLRYQSGDPDAANELIENNFAFIRQTALQYRYWYKNVRLDADDYTQVGSMAMLRTAQRFDPAKGYAFLTYAGSAVKNAIIDAIRTEYPDENIVPLEERVCEWEKDDNTHANHNNWQYVSLYGSNPERIYLQKERLEEVDAAVDALPQRDKTWIYCRFGFEDEEVRSLAETARMFHLSESRAKRTEREALKKVRKNLNKIVA